jgi:hypothetical protein
MGKLKLYFSVITPIVKYACVTWTRKETIAQRLMVFAMKILRNIFGPTYENGSWRIKIQESDKIIKYKYIQTSPENKDWDGFGHIERMQETRMVKEIRYWNPISKGQKTRWEDDVEKDIQKLKAPNWWTVVQDSR